MGTKHLTLYR